MELFNEFVIPPTTGHLELLRYLLVMALMIHLPYLALLLGATSVSVVLNWRDRDVANARFARLSKELMEMVIPSQIVALVLGVLPMIALWLIYGQWLYQSTATTMHLLPVGVILVALSFGPLNAYRATLYPEGRNSQINFFLGGAGLLTLIAGSYILVGSIVRFNDPERWHLAQNPLRLMLSFNIIWKYNFLLLSGLGLTGIAMLFFFFNWPGRRALGDDGYARFVKNFGAGMALPCLLLLPVMGFFYMVTTPIVGMSGATYGLAIAMSALLFLVFVYAYRTILDDKVRFGSHAFVLFLAVFTLVSVSDQMTLVNATKEHSSRLLTEARAREAELALEREAQRSAGAVVDIAKGEEVFKTVCMTCHRLDERLVGPPLKSVLPKYVGNMDELVSFIQKPSKKNPDYPPMPAPAIGLVEIKSVAAYLLEQVGGEVPGTGTGSGEQEDTPQH